MEIFFCEIAKGNVISEEQHSQRDNLARKVFWFRRQKDALKTIPSSPCSPCLSRSYVEQVSNVAWPKNKYCRPRSHSYPMIKRLNPLPRLIEEDETTEMEKPSVAYTRVPEVQTLNWTDNKLSDEWLYKINSLRSTLTSLETSTPKGPHRSAKLPLVNSNSGGKRAGFVTCRQDSPKLCTNASIKRLGNVVKDEPMFQSFEMRKPDSTYISLISGFTQETQKQAHAQSSGNEDDTNKKLTNSDLKKAKNCKNLKCIHMNIFAPRKLFCSSSPNTHRQMSNSSEYIQQIGRLGC